MINLQQLTNKVTEIAQHTGAFIAAERAKFSQSKVEVKGHNNFVSYVDKTAEEKIVTGLSQLLPEAGFIAEEGTSTKKGERYNWIIDPLDGTTNFIHGLPPYAISIALTDGEEVVLGVIFEVVLGECFYAWKGSKAYLNGNEINVSGITSVSGSLIATGFPYYDFGKVRRFLETLDYLFANSHGVRRIGSAATDLAYVACGRFEAFYEYGLQPWDVAAGALIVQQAGGKVTDFSNQKNYIFGREIIATNGIIHSEFSNIIAKHLKD
jgi:myo-inositol-1(or 4)-monophosphatase